VIRERLERQLDGRLDGGQEHVKLGLGHLVDQVTRARALQERPDVGQLAHRPGDRVRRELRVEVALAHVAVLEGRVIVVDGAVRAGEQVGAPDPLADREHPESRHAGVRPRNGLRLPSSDLDA
jgi:hypothetical protein